MPDQFDNSPKSDDPTVNPSHIGRIPRGFARNEENRRRTDSLAEQASKDSENAGSINPDKLEIDNDIAQYLDPFDGNWYISNRQPGRFYVGVKKDPIIISMYRRMGYEPVKENDPEAIEYKGQDAAGGSTLRGLGDVLLYWCPIELRQKWEERQIKQAIAVGAIELDEGPEAAWADDANDPRSMARQLGAMAHARRTDSKMQSTVFRGSAGQIEKLNQGIREGNIPNFEQTIRRG